MMEKSKNIQDIKHCIDTLVRPRILLKATRFALADYNRNRDLPILLRCNTLPCTEIIFDHLIALETKLEDNRTSGKGSYSISRHIQVLVALICEIKLVRHSEKITPEKIQQTGL